MISESEAAESLIAVCPSFQPRWQERLALDEGKRFGAYVDLGLLAEWVVDRLIERDLDCMSTLFAQVETLLTGASDDVRNVVVIGLMEDILYGGEDAGLDPDVIVRFLGPHAKKEWFWLTSTVGKGRKAP